MQRPSMPERPVKTRKPTSAASRSARATRRRSARSGFVFILVLLYAAFNASKLPIIGGGTVYTAMFTEDAGLVERRRCAHRRRQGRQGVLDVARRRPGQGEVQGQERVRRRPEHGRDQAQDAARREVPAIDSVGTKKQDPHAAIPKSRTTVAVRHLSGVHRADPDGRLDRHRPAGAGLRRAVARTSPDTPASVKPVLTGLSRLSTTIASRDTAAADAAVRRRIRSPTCSPTATSSCSSCSPTAGCCSTSSTRAATRSTRCWSTPRRCRSSWRAWSRTTRRRSARCWTTCTGAGAPAEQPGQPRPRPAVARAVLPGLRQRPRQRPLVRQLHLQPRPAVRRSSAARTRMRGACRHDEPVRTRDPRSSASWSLAVVAGGGGLRRSPAGSTQEGHRELRLRCRRLPGHAGERCSASRSARSPR